MLNLMQAVRPINTFGMPVKILGASIHEIQLKTRMPFKYGIATMTEVPMVFVRIEAEIDGTKTAGIASDLLPPKWFTKVPEDPPEKEISDMLQVIRQGLAKRLAKRRIRRSIFGSDLRRTITVGRSKQHSSPAGSLGHLSLNAP